MKIQITSMTCGSVKAEVANAVAFGSDLSNAMRIMLKGCQHPAVVVSNGKRYFAAKLYALIDCDGITIVRHNLRHALGGTQ